MMTSSNGNIFRVTGHLCGNSPVPGEFPTQRPVTRSFDVFFDLRLNKRLSKQSWGWWFETPPWSLWRQCNVATVELATHFTFPDALTSDACFLAGKLFEKTSHYCQAKLDNMEKKRFWYDIRHKCFFAQEIFAVMLHNFLLKYVIFTVNKPGEWAKNISNLPRISTDDSVFDHP